MSVVTRGWWVNIYQDVENTYDVAVYYSLKKPAVFKNESS